MAKKKNLIEEIDEQFKNNKDLFLNNLASEMYFKSTYSADFISFEWLDQFEFACPYIDIIVRNPKLALIKEEIFLKAERSKKVTVESIKDLAKHTNRINKYDEKKGDVEPEEILNVINEETFNTYENRFLYTLIHDMSNFVREKERELKDYKLTDNKLLEYSANSSTDNEKINIELKMTSETFPIENPDKKLLESIKQAKIRIKKIKDYISSWERSPMYLEISKAHTAFLKPPIKKTNVILKNPNFKIAVVLWDYILKYQNDDNNKKSHLEKEYDPILSFLDHSFLIDFCTLDSISKTKKEQKERLSKYALLMLTEEIRRVVTLLLNCGIKVTDEELLSMIAKELKKDRNNRLVGVEDVKKKFKNAMDEYLERTQDYL